MQDLNSTQSARVQQRLQQEEIVWLTTVSGEGQPQSSPVWFIWDGRAFLHYSAPDRKVRNIGHNPKVSLHLNDNGHGGDIVSVEGSAELVPDAPPPNENAAYLAKYREGIRGLGLTPESFAATYPQAVRVTPTRVRVW